MRPHDILAKSRKTSCGTRNKFTKKMNKLTLILKQNLCARVTNKQHSAFKKSKSVKISKKSSADSIKQGNSAVY